MVIPTHETGTDRGGRGGRRTRYLAVERRDCTAPYFITYKTILEYSAVLDARMKLRRHPTEVPPLLLTVCPDLDGDRYYREVSNPLSLFLYTRVLVSEEAYLEFSRGLKEATTRTTHRPPFGDTLDHPVVVVLALRGGGVGCR